jgi:hypothetical protein
VTNGVISNPVSMALTPRRSRHIRRRIIPGVPANIRIAYLYVSPGIVNAVTAWPELSVVL